MWRTGEGELLRMKRFARYLRCAKGTMGAYVRGRRVAKAAVPTPPRGVLNPEAVRKIVVYVDSDWTGCKTSPKLICGGMLIVEEMLVRSWSSTEATVATSSGEAEYNALVRGAAEALGLKAVLDELGW